VCKGGHQLYNPIVLQPRRQSGGPLPSIVKGRHKPMFTRPQLLERCAHYSTGYDNHIQNKPHNCRGPAIAHGSKAKPATRVSATQSKQSEGQSDTKDGQQLAHPGPRQGIPSSSSFVSESWPGSFLHAFCVGWHLVVRVLLIGITREHRMKPPGPYLYRGVHLPRSSPMERYFPLLALTRAW
jgi:hypothetical protein